MHLRFFLSNALFFFIKLESPKQHITDILFSQSLEATCFVFRIV